MHGLHLSGDELLLLADEELAPGEVLRAEGHLAECEECQTEYLRVRRASAQLGEFFASIRPAFELSERADLETAIVAAEAKPVRTSRRRGWIVAAAVAACLVATAIPVVRHSILRDAGGKGEVLSASGPAGSFELDGERFYALPYSNPDLPVMSPRVVQMEVPVASLAEAGIVLAPLSARVAQPDRAVLADVLLGRDGQPLGVHVLSSD